VPRKKSSALAKHQHPDAFDEQLAAVQLAHVQRLAAAHTEDAVRALVEIATGTARELEPDKEGYFPVLRDEDGEIVPVRVQAGSRASAAKALLEHAHGRPTQRVQHEGMGADSRITVVLHTFGPNQEQVIMDVTPTPERIMGGENPSTQ
jgi:hypothetical protein